MEARATKFMEFLKKSDQLVVPIYQRTYSWTEAECQQLWNDILRTGENENIKSHFLGSIVYIEKGQYQVTRHSVMLIIDGQQRLATVSLIIEALARELSDKESLDGITSEDLRDDYLLNSTKGDERRYKLLLSQTDKETLKALFDDKPEPNNYSVRLQDNFKFFVKEIEKLGGNCSSLLEGLSKLMVVDVSLSRGDDNPQLIFESMNSTGLDLSHADLIRNYLLMGLEPDEQDDLYTNYWRPMEEAFGQEGFTTEFDNFIRYYLAVKNKYLPNTRDIYREFKIFSQKYIKTDSVESLENLLDDICTYAKYYCAIALGKEKGYKLRLAFGDLHELKANVSYPLLMEVYDDYERELITIEELVKVVRLIECYVFRRSVCGIPTNSLNKTFASFGRKIDKENYIESIEANLLLFESYRRVPNDEEFYGNLITRNIYNFQRCAYLLRKLENHDRKESASINEYTIEHIMPQNKNLSDEWKQSLGSDWQHIHSEYLHTLGNLTLTGYNSEYSDKPFSEKRDMDGGFSESPILLNRGLENVQVWNEEEILKRAQRLAELAVEVWPYPSLSDEQLKSYHPSKSVNKTEYTISDHPSFDEGGDQHQIYTDLRQEIMSLDPCITEEFRKYYAVYIAERIFVSVWSTSNGLGVSLYIPFSEIKDPEGMARNVPTSYNYGRAEADLKLTATDDIPYVMSLIRQAFRHQMEEEE